LSPSAAADERTSAFYPLNEKGEQAKFSSSPSLAGKLAPLAEGCGKKRISFLN
jgi:hypothetical protein